MSPGIQTISQADLPLTVIGFDIKCPACGRPLVILSINQWGEDGRVPKTGLLVACSKQPSQESAKWSGWFERHYFVGPVAWDEARKQVSEWFNAYFRYRHVEPEVTAKVVAKRRWLKWRRAA